MRAVPCGVEAQDGVARGEEGGGDGAGVGGEVFEDDVADAFFGEERCGSGEDAGFVAFDIHFHEVDGLWGREDGVEGGEFYVPGLAAGVSFGDEAGHSAVGFPRGAGIEGETQDWDFGVGAGFYVNATQPKWSRNYRMWSYVTGELPALIAAALPVDMARQGITGHSMGGHGALTVALRHPERFRSVSAFAPIVAPGQVPWGEKALGRYLGDDRAAWRAHDAVALIEDGARVPELLIDIGESDPFFERELKPELLETACSDTGIALTLRRHAGYDHSYYFISTFMADHVRWHAERLKR